MRYQIFFRVKECYLFQMRIVFIINQIFEQTFVSFSKVILMETKLIYAVK